MAGASSPASETASQAVAGRTGPPRRASSRKTAARKSTPSNHQCPKSSKSNMATTTRAEGSRRGRLLEEIAEVDRVRGDPLRRRRRVVELLAVERPAGVGHRPVAKPPARRLPVELEVRRVPRVADLARPDLLRAARIARQDGDAPSLRSRPGGPRTASARSASPPPRLQRTPPLPPYAGRPARPATRCVSTKVNRTPRSARRERTSRRATRRPKPGVTSVPAGRVAHSGIQRPRARASEVPPVRREADVELAFRRRVGREERKEAVGRGAGDRFDLPFVGHPGEGGDEVAVERVEERERLLVVRPPRPGEELGPVAVPRELARVARGGGEPVADVSAEPARETGVAQLLAEDRCQADRRLPRDPVRVERPDGRDEREVGLGRRLVEPVGAMGPDAVSEDGGDVAVEDEDERDGRRGRLRGRVGRGPGVSPPGLPFRRRYRAGGRRSWRR